MSSKTSRQRLGQWGENLAAQYLQKRGYQVVARNVRGQYGEIDIIAEKKQTLIFVEVKTRSTDSFGMPEDAITPRKAERMILCAEEYLLEHPGAPENWRIDVIAIRRRGHLPPDIQHFENALM
jgi:putative endonuclease